MEKVRILVADDHAVVRRGLILVLRQEAGCEVVGEACDGVEAVALAVAQQPDMALLDWKMPRLDGLKAAAQIKARAPAVRTLILTGAPVEAAALDNAPASLRLLSDVWSPRTLLNVPDDRELGVMLDTVTVR